MYHGDSIARRLDNCYIKRSHSGEGITKNRSGLTYRRSARTLRSSSSMGIYESGRNLGKMKEGSKLDRKSVEFGKERHGKFRPHTYVDPEDVILSPSSSGRERAAFQDAEFEAIHQAHKAERAYSISLGMAILPRDLDAPQDIRPLANFQMPSKESRSSTTSVSSQLSEKPRMQGLPFRIGFSCLDVDDLILLSELLQGHFGEVETQVRARGETFGVSPLSLENPQKTNIPVRISRVGLEIQVLEEKEEEFEQTPSPSIKKNDLRIEIP